MPEENPAEEPLDGSQDMPDAAREEEEPEGESSSVESEFYFPPLKNDEAGFRPLPATSSSAARRRRRPNPWITRPEASELGERLENMAGRAAPTFDFFLFSLLAGVILGLGFLFDAPAVLFFGVLVASLLTPWMGVALAVAIGEIRFLGQTLGGFLTALFMVIVTGALAGLASRIFPSEVTTQALLHAQLSLFDLLLLAAGSLALTIAFVQSEEKPLLANLMLVYEIYLPASALGFGLGSGAAGLWPQALLVLLVHLTISLALALIVFYYMGFRPIEIYGYMLMGLAALAALAAILASFLWGGNIPVNQPTATPQVLIPTHTAPVIQPTLTAPEPSPTQPILTPTRTLTAGPTPIPTPVYGRVRNDGAYIRDEPGGAAITTLQSGYLVEILPDTPLVLEGTTWVRIRVTTTTRDVVGWVLLDLIVTATPLPAPPTETPTITTTPTITETPTTGPSPTPTETLQATGSYAVVNITQYEATLNVRSRAGVGNPLVGSLAYTATDIGRVGAPVIVGSSEWWQIQEVGGITGWVNAFYLTEYVLSTTFCADARVGTLLTDLGTALKNVDGPALAILVSPRHGLDIRLASTNAPVNYSKDEAASIFTNTTAQNWGVPPSGNVAVNGSFLDVIQPKLLEVYNANPQLGCNDTARLGGIKQPWPAEYATINFYSLYKPSVGDAPSWRDFLVGIEYVDGKPFLFSLIYFEPQ